MYALLAVGLVLSAPGVKDPPKKAEPPGLVGEWKVEEATVGGNALPGAIKDGLTIEFTADGKYLIRVNGQSKEATYATTAGKEVNEIDFKDPTGRPALGIYKFEKETLTLCMAEGNNVTRPASFESPAGSRVMLMTLKRVEKKKE